MKYGQHYPELQDKHSPGGARTIAERLLPGFRLNLLRNAIDPPQTDGWKPLLILPHVLCVKLSRQMNTPLTLQRHSSCLLATFSVLLSFLSRFDLLSPPHHLLLAVPRCFSPPAGQHPSLCTWKYFIKFSSTEEHLRSQSGSAEGQRLSER